MKRILMALAAAIVIAAAGFFGFELYAQHRIVGEIDAFFDQIRATGGKASHGKVSFNPWKRTLTIADIAAESATQPPVGVKIANFTASGVGQPDATHVSAEDVEVADMEIGVDMAGWQQTYKVPRIAAKAFSGPALLPVLPVSPSTTDIYRFVVARFIDISASSISAPSVTGTMGSATVPAGEVAFSYSGFTLKDIKGGKIASSKLDEMTITIDTPQAGKATKLTGHIANIAFSDFDMTATAALLDPQQANDTSIHRMYGQISTGAYEVAMVPGVHMRIDGITIDDVSVRPSQARFPAYLAAMPSRGTIPTPEQTREIAERTAEFYEGISIGKSEIHGISVETPQGPVKLAAVRLNLDNGKGDFSLEGLDSRSSQGPFQVGRFTLKSFDIPKLLRMSAQLPGAIATPAAGQALALFGALGGAEVRDVVAPFKNGKRSVKIDTISLNWGQLIGQIPTQAHLVAKMTTPIDATNQALLPLLAAGIDTAAIDADIGTTWTEASGAFTLEPAKIQLGDLVSASARISLTNVPREVFTSDPQQATRMAAQIEAGALELTLQDLGGVDLLIGQYARAKGIGREAARSAIIDTIKSGGETAAAANRDAIAAMEALVRFIETPHQTLIIKLTPVGKVPVLPLLQLVKTDPFNAVAPFKIEASTGL